MLRVRKFVQLTTHLSSIYVHLLRTLCKDMSSDALAFGREFEHAVFDKSKLTKILNQPGSSLLKDVK